MPSLALRRSSFYCPCASQSTVGTSVSEDDGYGQLLENSGLRLERSRSMLSQQLQRARSIAPKASTGNDTSLRLERSRIGSLCSPTLGNWCRKYHRAPSQPFKPVPRGSKQCPKDCSGVGNCNHDSGLCECPAGERRSRAGACCQQACHVALPPCRPGASPAADSRWCLRACTGYTGEDCSEPFKRPCSNRHAEEDKGEVHPTSHIDEDGRDLDWLNPGWLAGRCAGGLLLPQRVPRGARDQAIV